MRFELLDLQTAQTETTTIRRISALGVHWRVQVEAYRGVAGWVGRLVFEPHVPGTRYETRHGPATLRGRTRAEVVAAAHELDERRLLVLLHSLG
ncbi:MAG TPA: hypothetical protein VF158_16010 [Longimicrobiales bacterium]